MNFKRLIPAGLLSLLLAPAALLAQAQDAYPNKPIKVVVPFPAGGATDILTRAITEKLAVRIGQSVIIENRPGAGANIGAATVAKAPKTRRASACRRSQSSCQKAWGMIRKAVVARQAKSQILAASSTGEAPTNCRDPSCRQNAQNPIRQRSTHESPPILVFIGASARVSAKKANARAGNGRRDNA